MLPPTQQRVQRNTATAVNRRIALAGRDGLARYGQDPMAIRRRLGEIEREWDIERAVEVGAAGVVLGGLALGRFAGRRWNLLPAAAAVFLLQHALQGWSPPIPVLRRLGFRTVGEINTERKLLERRIDALSRRPH